MFRLRFASAAFAAFSLILSLPAAAQNSDYFIPNQARPAQGRPVPRAAPRAQAPALQAPSEPSGPVPGEPPSGEAENQPPPQVPMPPVPNLPPLERASLPPAAVIGVIGVPDVMRGSTAAQQIDKTIGERREKLNADAQKEQAAWRDMQQALAKQRSSLSPEQISAKERELQDRITNAQRQFRDRNMIIQEAAQYALNQIQAQLIAIIRQVAEAHGMNLILHRTQVALNVNEFDITAQVLAELNKDLPSVNIPPEGVSPVAKTDAPAAATPAAAPATAAAPAAKKP